MADPVALYRAGATVVRTAGQAVDALYGPMLGGVITNPATAEDQGIPVVEELYVDIAGTAALAETATTVPVQPGQTFVIPAGQSRSVSVNAATSGHKFSAYAMQAPTPYPPSNPGTFPPSGPTTLLATIPSYLYRQYADDENLQAFVRSFNRQAQEMVDWFNKIGLPVYTGAIISGTLLDWVGNGLYGVPRPSLSSGRNRNKGPYNTMAYNTLPPYNGLLVIGPQDVAQSTDDIYKRVITWNFFKGDGHQFNVRWLKRRIIRFLLGVNGINFNVDQTYKVSVTFGTNYQVNINLQTVFRTVTGGAIYNRFAYNKVAYNSLLTTASQVEPLPNALILKEAIEAGVLQLPFQFNYVVNVS